MYSIGDAIVYGTHGVCVVESIISMPLDGVEKEYYILAPVADSKSTIYVPCDNESLVSQMRPVMSKKEVENLFSNIGKSDIEWISKDAERKEFCRSVLKSGDRLGIIGVIRMLYFKREEFRKEKKHFHVADEKNLNIASKLINSEISYVLGIPQGEVSSFIENILSNDNKEVSNL